MLIGEIRNLHVPCRRCDPSKCIALLLRAFPRIISYWTSVKLLRNWLSAYDLGRVADRPTPLLPPLQHRYSQQSPVICSGYQPVCEAMRACKPASGSWEELCAASVSLSLSASVVSRCISALAAVIRDFLFRTQSPAWRCKAMCQFVEQVLYDSCRNCRYG